MKNFICFLTPVIFNQMLSNTLRLTDAHKEFLQAESITMNEYNRILQVHTSGCVVVVVGSKDNDQMDALKADLEQAFKRLK